MLTNETVIRKDLPEFDLTQPAIETQIEKARPNIIIHAGAYTDVDGAKRTPNLAMAMNRDGTARVARADARVGSYLIYVSTDRCPPTMYLMELPRFPTAKRISQISSTPMKC